VTFEIPTPPQTPPPEEEKPEPTTPLSEENFSQAIEDKLR